MIDIHGKEVAYPIRFTQGENVHFDRMTAPYGSLYRLENARIGNGIIERDLGWQHWTNQIPGATGTCEFAYRWEYDIGSTQYEMGLFVFDSKLYSWNGSSTTFTALASGLGSYHDATYFSEISYTGSTLNSTFDYIIYTDSANVYTINAQVPSVASANSHNPVGDVRRLATYENRVVYNNRVLRNSLTFSDMNDRGVSDFNKQTIHMGDANSLITALVPFKGMLHVFFDNSIWGVTGEGRLSWRSRELISDIGCKSKNAIAIYNGQIYFANPKGIYRYSGGSNRPELIYDFYELYKSRGSAWLASSQAAERAWTATIDRYENAYVISMRSAGGSYNDVAIRVDLDTGLAVRLTDFPAGDMEFFNSGIVFGASGAGSAGEIYKTNFESDSDKYTFDGTAFQLKIQTPYYHCNMPHKEKIFTKTDFLCNTDSSDTDITCKMNVDYIDDVKSLTISTASTGSLYGDLSDVTGTRGLVKSYNSVLSDDEVYGRYISYDITTSSEQNTKIYGINQWYKVSKKNQQGVKF